MTIRRGLIGCGLLALVIIALVVGIFIAPLVHISVGQTNASNGGNTPITGTGGGYIPTGNTNATGNQQTAGSSWTDLEGKINLQPRVDATQVYANVYHIGDNNSGPYTASCYGNVVFEITGADGANYIIACSANPSVPSFVGATIWNNGKDACTIYQQHLSQFGAAKVVGASC